jgi:uncharacterized protein YecT (DUF1311 family)
MKTRRKIGIATTIALVATALTASPAAALPANLDAHYENAYISEARVEALTSATYRRCMDRSGGVTVAMRDCAGVEYDRIDALLNQRYQQLMRTLSPRDQARLRRSERHWLAFRYEHCDRAAGEDSGTLSLIVRDGCVASELRRRLLWLRTIN